MARLSSLPCCRLLVLGDSGVGKSALIVSLASSVRSASSSSSSSLSASFPGFSPVALSTCSPGSSLSWTIGCCPQTLLLTLPPPSASPVFIELFDVGGHRKYSSSRLFFYRGVDGVLLLFDLSNRKSYRNLSRWIHEMQTANAQHPMQDDRAALDSLPVLLVGNKRDLVPQAAEAAAGFDSMRDFGLQLVLTSAASGREEEEGARNLQLLLPFIIRVLEEKRLRQGGGGAIAGRVGDGREAAGRQQQGVSLYQRKGSAAGSASGRGGWRGRAADAEDDAGQETAEEEDGGGGLTIDMDQLDSLATPVVAASLSSFGSPAAGSSSSSSSSTSSRLSASPLRRLLSVSLFSSSAGKSDRTQQQQHSRV